MSEIVSDFVTSVGNLILLALGAVYAWVTVASIRRIRKLPKEK